MTDHSDDNWPEREAAHPDSGQQARQALQHRIQLLTAAVEACLRQARSGLSELELIRQLQAPPWELLGKVDYANPAALYPVHFLLFHVLYRLRDELAGTGEVLSISPLSISLTTPDTIAGTGVPDQADPLRAFYLDLDQYEMPADEVHRMVDDFWAGRTARRPRRGAAEQAAIALGFNQLPADFAEVKVRFRRAVMKAHPDRGGNTGDVQRLNDAFATLRHYFRHGELTC
ncbi:DNA-J related protein [Marinobacter daqiaonensis]|uniref:DNA-J related protein n=1 Tax=Marinobacter daqiaonensis TaxID=650891 RepID=A0A1I6H2V4_9GAMM|nr:DNA-J related domain-containing protein [Marinobacter daqiaonensis]SFR48718.1 DNA-J related protein [Marinobacter daqiaonensis]